MVRSYRRPSEFELLGDNGNDSHNTSLDTNTFNDEDNPPRNKRFNSLTVKIASASAVILLAGVVALVLFYGSKKITEGGGEINDASVNTLSFNVTTKINIPTTLNPEKTNYVTKTTSSNREITHPTTKTIEMENKTSDATTIHRSESKTTPSISKSTLISTSPSSETETSSILTTTKNLTPSKPLSTTQITENTTELSSEAEKTSISKSIEATTILTSPTTIISNLQSTEIKTTSTSQAMSTISTLESTEVKITSSKPTTTSTLEITEAKTTSTSQATTISTSSSTQGITSTSETTLSSTLLTTKSIPSTSLPILSSTTQSKVESPSTTTFSSNKSNTNSSQTTETPNVTTTVTPSTTLPSTSTSITSVQSTPPANFTTPTTFEPFTSVSTTPAGPRYPLPKSQIEVGTWYIIMSVFDGTVWDVYGGGLGNGAKIGLWPYLGQTNQHFRFDQIQYNQVTKIEARRSGKSIVYRSNAKLFQQWDNGLSSDGLWKVMSVTKNTGIIQIRNEEFKKCASLKRENLNSPDVLTLADCTDTFSHFRLIPVCDDIYI